MSEFELWTPSEYARWRRTSTRTLDRERATGQGCPYVKIRGRILYRRVDAEHHLETHLRRNGFEAPSVHSTRHSRRPRGRPRKITTPVGAAP